MTNATSRRALVRFIRRLAFQPRTAVRKLISWESNDERFSSWLAHETKFDDIEPDYQAFRALLEQSGRQMPMDRDDVWPCMTDRVSETPFDRHYTYHPAWAARVLARTRPAKHVDIASTLSFSAILSAFIPVAFYDFRPAPLRLSNLDSGRADLSRLDFADGAIPSLSTMHVIEHIGLGRYGDPLDANGDLKAIEELVRVLAPDGNLLIAVPVGRQRIQFNAHRIYDHKAFRDYFAELDLVEFALIPDEADGLIYDPPDHLVNRQVYGCGCYWFRKPGR